jgi:amino acid transporter
MTAANTERWKAVVGQLRLNAASTVTVTWLLGGYVALSMWKKHDDFYPFQLILFGFFTIAFSRSSFRYLAGLSWSVMPEEARRKKLKARRLMAYILCTMLVWFCSAVCLVGAKIFGRLYTVSAVVMGIFMIWMALVTDREIRRLASCFFNPGNESINQVGPTPD